MTEYCYLTMKYKTENCYLTIEYKTEYCYLTIKYKTEYCYLTIKYKTETGRYHKPPDTRPFLFILTASIIGEGGLCLDFVISCKLDFVRDCKLSKD